MTKTFKTNVKIRAERIQNKCRKFLNLGFGSSVIKNQNAKTVQYLIFRSIGAAHVDKM